MAENTLSLLKSRRSIRKYKDEPVPRHMLNTIVACGLNAPTGHNRQPWKLVVVTEKKRRAALAGLCPYGRFLKEAGACVAVFVSKEATTPVEDASAAMSFMIAAAQAHHLGTCWIWANRCPHTQAVSEYLGAPGDYELLELLAIGWPDEAPERAKKDPAELVCWEAFS